MAAADLDAGQIGGDQCHCDAEFILITDKMIRIIGLEGQSQQRRNRAERDVTLVPVQPEAQNLFTLERTLADDAGIDHCGSVGAGLRAGEAKARNVTAVGQAGQPALALVIGAEMHQQLAGPERVGHHYGDSGDQRSR